MKTQTKIAAMPAPSTRYNAQRTGGPQGPPLTYKVYLRNGGDAALRICDSGLQPDSPADVCQRTKPVRFANERPGGFTLIGLSVVLAIIVVSIGLLAPAVVNAAAPTVVYPTGQWPADVSSVQAAANTGGTVLLKAVNTSGVPTAFNFGTPEFLPGRHVLFETDVEVHGEQVGNARTTIQGGLGPFRGLSPVRREFHNIDFSGGMDWAIGIGASKDRLEISGVHVRHVIPAPFSASFFQAQGITISGGQVTDVSGMIVIEDNDIDLSDATTDLVYGVQLDTVSGKVSIKNNHVTIGQSQGGELDSEGILAVRCHDDVLIMENSIKAGAYALDGIGGVGTPDANFKISNNVVTSEGLQADGIALLGDSTQFGGVVRGVIAENDVTVHNTVSGISLYGLVSGVTVRDNTIAGRAAYALRITQGFDPSDMATQNLFRGNEVSDFKAGTADVFLDINSSSNIVLDSCGTSIDLGTGNVVRCGD